MGFLIKNLIENKNDYLNMQCVIKYAVNMEHILKDGTEDASISEIKQYKIMSEVFFYGDNTLKDGIGYKYEKTIDILEIDDVNNNRIYKQNDDTNNDSIINKYLERDESERFIRSDAQDYDFVVNVHKFVLDYERQILFFKTKCNYVNDYEDAVSNNEIQEFTTKTHTTHEKYKEKRTAEEKEILEERYVESGAKYAATKKRLKEKEVEVENNRRRGRGEDGESRNKRGFLPVVPGEKGEGDKKEVEEDLSFPDMRPPHVREGLTTSLTQVQPPPASVPVAAQALSKRSKVSLSRQQAANATMEES